MNYCIYQIYMLDWFEARKIEINKMSLFNCCKLSVQMIYFFECRRSYWGKMEKIFIFIHDIMKDFWVNNRFAEYIANNFFAWKKTCQFHLPINILFQSPFQCHRHGFVWRKLNFIIANNVVLSFAFPPQIVGPGERSIRIKFTC